MWVQLINTHSLPLTLKLSLFSLSLSHTVFFFTHTHTHILIRSWRNPSSLKMFERSHKSFVHTYETFLNSLSLSHTLTNTHINKHAFFTEPNEKVKSFSFSLQNSSLAFKRIRFSFLKTNIVMKIEIHNCEIKKSFEKKVFYNMKNWSQDCVGWKWNCKGKN